MSPELLIRITKRYHLDEDKVFWKSIEYIPKKSMVKMVILRRTK